MRWQAPPGPHPGAMPELPEVETVRRGLQRLLGAKARIARVELKRADIRRPIPRRLPAALKGARILGVARRAKYLLFRTTQGTMLSHLGMTGSWRVAPAGDERIHDHLYLHLEDGRRLAFRDPRRFGLVDLLPPEGRCVDLDGLGPEPLDEGEFSAEALARACRGRRAPIKAVIMDQSVVVGIGNIYAQEALFRAGIRPSRQAGSLDARRIAALVHELREVLTEAIGAGGSTISDFRQAGGESGYFQTRFRVYGRAGEPCPACGNALAGATVGGRGTSWCRRCQR
jgi:formamidopyrimidine-DNA glycosylase